MDNYFGDIQTQDPPQEKIEQDFKHSDLGMGTPVVWIEEN